MSKIIGIRGILFTLMALAIMSMISQTYAAVPSEPHDADAMWVEPSSITLSPSNASLGYKFNVTVWLNITSANVFGYQVSMLYNRDQLACLRADFSGAGKSDFMTGHSTQTAGPLIDTETTLGNGSVQAFESCKGSDNVIVPRAGSLIWIEFQVVAVPPSGETYTSKFDITSTSPSDNWVKDEFLSDIAVTTYDGSYVFTSGVAPPTMYGLTISATSGGTTDPAPGLHMYQTGTVVSVEALADVNYALVRWELDGVNVGSANPYSVTMGQNHTLKAVFWPLYTLTVVATAGGTANPVPGQYKYLNGTVVSVTAVNNTGYVLHHWELDGVNIGSANPVSVTMDMNHTLKAVFARTGGEIIGDVNHDGHVDGQDLMVVIKAFASYKSFGSYPDHPRWNPDADVNGDNRIDGSDLIKICKHFGESIP